MENLQNKIGRKGYNAFNLVATIIYCFSQYPKGIEIRINRSIQIEDTFGQLKQNMNYERIRRHGLERVSCEIMLMCLGRNIRKIFILLNSDKIKSNYLEKTNNLKTEKLPFPKQKRLNKNYSFLLSPF